MEGILKRLDERTWIGFLNGHGVQITDNAPMPSWSGLIAIPVGRSRKPKVVQFLKGKSLQDVARQARRWIERYGQFSKVDR